MWKNTKPHASSMVPDFELERVKTASIGANAICLDQCGQ